MGQRLLLYLGSDARDSRGYGLVYEKKKVVLSGFLSPINRLSAYLTIHGVY